MFDRMKISIRVFFNNLRARIGMKLARAGFGGIVNGWTELEVSHFRNGKVIKSRKVLNRVVTNAFVNDIVDSMQGLSSPYTNFKNYKYHGSGTGTTAEAATQTALVAQVGSRTSGTQVEGDANEYVSVATITYSTSSAITEHGLFNAATGGVLCDRTVFAPVNVISGDSIQFTFSIKFTSGG